MIRENEAVTSTFAFFYFTPKSLANIHYFFKQNLFVKIFFLSDKCYCSVALKWRSIIE